MAPIRLTATILLLMLSAEAAAKGVDVAADTISRDASGAIVAEGDVVITREGETLKADKVIYDTEKKQINASGKVLIETKQAIIHAEEAEMQTEDRSGNLKRASATFNEGQRLQAELFQRLDEGLYHAEDALFSSCPPEDESWAIHASSADLDQREGYLTARNARFEVAGMPVLYTPYWRHSLRRRSGLLMPSFGSSKRRGTEWAIPYYLAPSPNWDATLTPRWMTRRGLMGELEVRHASLTGNELIRGEGLNDKVLSRQRSRLQAEVHHAFQDIRFDISADHISDLNYLADFPQESELATKRYLQSQASLSGIGEYGHWMLLGSHQQDLHSLTNNATTLQILPRLETHMQVPFAGDRAFLLFEHQTTRFQRKRGVDGWRMDLNPAIEVPWQMAGGGLLSTLQVGMHHTHYWLKDFVGLKTPSRDTFEASLETRAVFERINDARTWRHAIMPVIRLDISEAPDQSTLPNFDSRSGRLSMNSLLSGNRYTGYDRIERVRRISLLIETDLQHKDEAENIDGSEGVPSARDVLVTKIGASYDYKRQSVDPVRFPVQARPLSNLLGSIMVSPWRGISLTAEGQYDHADRYWATTHAVLAASTEDKHHQFKLTWRETDARYARAARMLTVYGTTRVAARWDVFGNWQYDYLLKLTQQASTGIHYTHPCWDLMVEGYRSNLAGSDAAADYGFRFLLGFKGLGSVGS